MNSKPLVSILMTSFNREKYIGEAIESVLSTTYENFEFIIVDDCSTDRTVEIIKSYQQSNPVIQLYINEVNLGDYPNRNRAASYAKGKYLKYVDSDDMIFPYCIEAMVYFMEQCPTAAVGLMGVRLKSEGTRKFPIVLNSDEAFERHYFKSGIFNRAPLSSIIRKEAMEAIGGFTEERVISDFITWHKFANSFPIAIIPFGLVWYRSHGDQEMTQSEIDVSVHYKYLLYSYKFIHSSECKINEGLKRAILESVRKKMNRYLMRVYLKNSIKKGNELRKLKEAVLKS
ncbi:MAG TPA: glycosyltransferase family 2 protein [Ferruginibacter sp.]|nr:glycosyltransferase family 2 protein [Ferruginibacter sp.]HRO05301.1 glycosyltransferase family 2 protein [Ferruginibacter sp.]HRO96065.1 glycosyltransferase family 2 protein [Ferruginibacter sp.]HRP48601.1 glycosyltransferase family 2 protein [Ferruginibacter sp.]